MPSAALTEARKSLQGLTVGQLGQAPGVLDLHRWPQWAEAQVPSGHLPAWPHTSTTAGPPSLPKGCRHHCGAVGYLALDTPFPTHRLLPREPCPILPPASAPLKVQQPCPCPTLARLQVLGTADPPPGQSWPEPLPPGSARGQEVTCEPTLTETERSPG